MAAVLRWDCQRDGCFNVKHRLKFGAFAEAMPGKISFTDVDAITEYCGRALMLEWKSAPDALPVGQKIMFQRLTRDMTVSVLCVAGDAETMTATHVAAWWAGNWHAWKPATTADLNTRIKNWFDWSARHSRLHGGV